MIQQIIDVEEEEEFSISEGQEETKQSQNWKTQTAERGKQEWDQQITEEKRQNNDLPLKIQQSKTRMFLWLNLMMMKEKIW